MNLHRVGKPQLGQVDLDQEVKALCLSPPGVLQRTLSALCRCAAQWHGFFIFNFTASSLLTCNILDLFCSLLSELNWSGIIVWSSLPSHIPVPLFIIRYCGSLITSEVCFKTLMKMETQHLPLEFFTFKKK